MCDGPSPLDNQASGVQVDGEQQRREPKVRVKGNGEDGDREQLYLVTGMNINLARSLGP